MFDRTAQIAVTSGALTHDLRQAPAMARQMGFSGLQLPAFSAAMNLPDLSDSGRREIRRLLAAQQVSLVSLSLKLGPHGLGVGADVDRALERVDQAMKAARGLGSPTLCIDLGILPPAPLPPPKPKASQDLAGLLILPPSAPASAPAPVAPLVDPKFISQVDAALANLGQRADRYAVMTAFRSDLSGFAALDRTLSSARCSWFGVDLDPVALLCDELDCDEVFSRLGSVIRHVHGRDAVAGERGRSRPAVIGQGGTNWPDLLAHLDAADCRGWLTIDPCDLQDYASAAMSGAKHLQAILSR